ncbi:hypothetical protein AVEN_268768-1 [Araneus ventricosus]|uniref:Uncharacterized protein n=1 Tax=Araneus ventricosus TaxID=182803 RepID=A0A4Y2K886_ARAVE|nr:hypothetical protein AVEN_268768-1 [Araneus ventricosus]
MKEEQSNGMSRLERISQYLHNFSEARASNEKKHDEECYCKKLPHHPIKGKMKHSQMSHNHDHTSPADMVAKANLPCLSKGSKPRKNHENTIPEKEEHAKSERNENSKGGIDSGKRKGKEPVLFTAVKEESSLLKDQPGKVTNVRFRYDSPQLKAQIADLEERPPKQALIVPKTSSINIYEAVS